MSLSGTQFNPQHQSCSRGSRAAGATQGVGWRGQRADIARLEVVAPLRGSAAQGTGAIRLPRPCQGPKFRPCQGPPSPSPSGEPRVQALPGAPNSRPFRGAPSSGPAGGPQVQALPGSPKFRPCPGAQSRPCQGAPSSGPSGGPHAALGAARPRPFLTHILSFTTWDPGALQGIRVSPASFDLVKGDKITL